MQFSISKKEFSQLLYLSTSLVEKRNTMPILANVKLTAKDGLLSIAATDLEVSLIGEAESEVKTPGSITVDAKVLYEIVRELPDNLIQCQVTKGQRLEIESGKSKFKINGTSSDEFPAIVGITLSNPDTIDAARLCEMIERTAFSISTDETRYNINGVFAEMVEADNTNGRSLRFVATDGHRLAIIDRAADGLEINKPVIIPKKGITELKKVLEGNEGAASVAVKDGFFTVKSGLVTLGARLVDGQFPDYRQVIPDQSTVTFTTSRNEFLSSVKRVALVTTDKSKAIKLNLVNGILNVSSSSPEHGEASDSLNVEQDGEDVAIGFSARYLMDILNAMSNSETISVRLNGDLGPGVFYGDSDESYRCIVMPMRFE
jgi:DNA polymerase-3 subunit beta